MAKYTVTASVDADWNVEYHYNYRFHSRNGQPVAQAEFDQRRGANQPAVLWRWDYPNRPVLVARHNA